MKLLALILSIFKDEPQKWGTAVEDSYDPWVEANMKEKKNE